jgi:hypothetical protein
MNKMFILSAIVALILQSCALQVNLLNPKPNLYLNEEKEKLALVLADDIKDIFVVPKNNGVKQFNVTEWHNSLKQGFVNGFRDYYTIVDDKADAGLILELTRADFEFVPADVGAYWGVRSTFALNAQITFKAKLTAKNGEVINKNAGTAFSKSAGGDRAQFTKAAESSIESMYEIIGKELFIK